MNKSFQKIKLFFYKVQDALVRGDIWVKLSTIIMGAGYFRRRQIARGVFITIFQMVFLLYTGKIAIPYLMEFGTLGSVTRAMEFNPVTMKNEVNDYDNSFQILLFGIVSIIIFAAFLIIWLHNLIQVRALQKLDLEKKHIPSFKEEVRELLHGKFYKTLLFFPCMGVVVFTIVPLIVLIAVAFTNYDQSHMPPTNLFTWVGFANFKALFTSSTIATFGYSFKKVLTWTLVWAFFATFTTYFGGIFLATFINNKKTKAKKLWRTMFVIAIAVPQFVTLLLVRNFFADNGIVNHVSANLGFTELFKNMGLVGQGMSYIPFLTDPNWAKVMIILINVWVGVPFLLLIATGVLMNIPVDLMESARIDGANSFQIFRKITMPYILFVTGPYLITSFVGNINNFNVIYLLTQDVFTTRDQALANSHAKEVDLLTTWLYRLTQEYYNYKMASVIGIMVFIICAVFTLFAFNFMMKGDKEESFQ